ncbi:MAG: AAA family ATPase [Methanoregulaceae archaeon]|nr:AAA family ATPase [Methanoregulaceae archaeon]
MMFGITGTPGTGKSTLAELLLSGGFRILHLSETFGPYLIGRDTGRETMVIDEERWAGEFGRFEGVVEGHLAHLLPCDRIVILRCRPDVLACRLRERGYPPAKITENSLAEALDVVLVETLESFSPEQVYELDTTDKTIQECADLAEKFFHGNLPPSHGSLDWSSYIGIDA